MTRPRAADDFPMIRARMEELRRERVRPRAADDFATIRARMEELRRERAGAQAAESDLRDPPMHRDRSERWPPSEISAGTGRVRQSGPIRS